MHSDRIGPTAPRVLPPLSDRVIGLGSPVSVVIHPDPCEVPLMAAGIRKVLAEHEAQRPQVDEDASEEELRGLRLWDSQRGEWQLMLDSLQAAGESAIELLWPSSYAFLVLRGAVVAAEKAHADAPGDAAATRALESARATLKAFSAVESGGLQEWHL